MVKDTIIGPYRGPPSPADVGSSRKIPDGPLYSALEIQKVLDKGTVKPATVDCVKNLQALGLDENDLKCLISEAIKKDNYKDSEWALLFSKTTDVFERRTWMACDAYVYKREEFIDASRKYMTVEYYLKFGLSNSADNVLTVSVHL